MSKREPLVALRHMRDHAREALALIQYKHRVDLDTDRLLNLSLVRLLEIVGEAATRVSPADRTRYTAIPWSQIIALRNRLIHGYDTVDFDIMWEILTNDLPPLLATLDAIIAAQHDTAS